MNESDFKPITRVARYEVIDELNDLSNQVFEQTKNYEFREKFKTILRRMNDI